ncbi:hypothetical protein [Altericroceibacterium endophyticum]|uniref:2-hydroxyacyl-CoA dehydratase n=1 Tax=Altericroceibacterium endophyticum TaxID=1808508 RepID=A0A6I4T9B9_9SPHN|nr:hypothetical protein [Altericroceibacterium endophyticum]MXO66751.1 hypothetical protein [Altericroceibacterium endophyticum]
MIASAGPNLPLDVLRATGAYAGPLPIDLDKNVTTADAWMESKFAPWAPLALQAWADGDYDHLDCVIFSRADDTAQRFYYYICELQRRGLVGGPKALIFDIAMIPRASSLERTTQKVRELAELLGVDDVALENAITSSKQSAPATSPDHPVCLIAGSPMPDHRLHIAVQAAGFAPIGQTLAEYWCEGGPVIEGGTGDPAAAIACHLHEGATGPRSFGDRSALLRERLARTQARAAILWRIEEDEAQVWHLPAERRVLEESGLPHLVMTRRDWFARDGAIEEISQFLTGADI